MRSLLALFLAALCGLCFADDGAERLAAAKRLVELTGMAESTVMLGAACLPSESQVSALAKSAYEQHPDTFEGITPQSAYWQDFERIYKTYTIESCLYLIPDVLAAAHATALAEKVPLPELQAAIQFYSSPEGQKFMSAAAKAAHTFSAELKQAEAASFARANANYRNRLRKLIEQYGANPK